MIKQEVIEKIADNLANRIEETNTFIIRKIGETIKAMSNINSAEAYQLGQILKYGGDFKEIVDELSKVSGKSVEDIYKIFDKVAESNKAFAKDFYKYRNIEYVPYYKDSPLRQEVRNIATLTANTYSNIANTTGIGFLFTDKDGNKYFRDIKQAYNEIIDRGILAINQGKTTFDEEMKRIIDDIGHNGVVEYESGYTRRLDSAVRMNLLDGIRELNNANNIRFGNEYGADGVEISVHGNPAPDHADIQGRQFSNEEYAKLQNGDVAKDYKGVNRQITHAHSGSYRQISQYNCYHTIFAIVLGVSEPEYTEEQLNKIEADNEKGFEFEGKHYTNYEGTQLQRRLETEIRKAKDKQILAKASGDDFIDIVDKSQKRVTTLTHKYNELCKVSGLPPKKERTIVRGYKEVTIKKEPTIQAPKQIINKSIQPTIEKLKSKNVVLQDSFLSMPDENLRNELITHLDTLTDEYKFNKDTIHPNITLDIMCKDDLGGRTGTAQRLGYINLNRQYFKDKDLLINTEKMSQDTNWHPKTPEDKIQLCTLTHEYGHMLEFNYYEANEWKKIPVEDVITTESGSKIKTSGFRTEYTSPEKLDTDLKQSLVKEAMSKLDTKMTTRQFKEKYWSGYARSKTHDEWFAESFVDYKLNGKNNVWTETFGNWLEGYFNGK